MTEEEIKEADQPEKLLIDNSNDFRFHAAYLAYAKIFDEIGEPEIKRELNQHIESLQKNEIDYPTFYRQVSRYRSETDEGQRRDRMRLRTQRKREWRTATQKRERIRRHKK